MTTEDQLQRFLDRLENTRTSGAGYSAKCPAHDDHVASLSVSLGEKGGVVVHCHAGCLPADVVGALGIPLSDLAGAPYIEERYVYQNLDESTAWTVERWANPKDFRVNPFLPTPADRVIYNLPWVDYARRVGQTVYIVEGEKDVETLREYGHVGTCNVGGAGPGKWLPHYNDWLFDCEVIIIADNDEPGLRHGRAVFRAVSPKARSCTLARPLYGKDVSDLLRAGYPVGHLEPVPEEAPLASVLASSVRPQHIRWAWERYIPMGTMSIIEGDPGDGKSTLTCDLVARWSSGIPMPDGSDHGGPWHTMMVSAEDDPAATIVPRLVAAGANLDKIVLVTGGQSEELPYNLGVDMEATERQIRQYGTRILVLDPLMAFLPERNNGLVDSEVRKALAPLSSLARRLDVAVIVVRHLTKSATRALYAGSGSIGIVGAARAAFLVKPSKADPELRIMAPTKTNLVRMPTALGYRMEDDPLRGVPRVRWEGAVDFTADTLFEQPAIDHNPNVRAMEVAADWLKDVLDGVQLMWPEVAELGRANGFSSRILEKARTEVAIHQKNPVIDGRITEGVFWRRVDQVPGSSLSGSTTRTPGTPWKSPALRIVNAESHLSVEDSGISSLSGSTDRTEGRSQGGPGVRSVDPESDRSAEEPRDREAELMAQDRVCDVCGSVEAILFLAPHWVIRCRAHDPNRWTP